jgi:hypothetical protein
MPIMLNGCGRTLCDHPAAFNRESCPRGSIFGLSGFGPGDSALDRRTFEDIMRYKTAGWRRI